MKALSLWQPWAFAVIFLGKPIENRNWRFPPSYRGPLAIHASLHKPTAHEIYACLGMYRAAEREAGREPDKDLEAEACVAKRGGIVGVVDMVGVVTESDSPWYTGSLGFVFENPRPVPFQRCRGRQGFFEAEVKT